MIFQPLEKRNELLDYTAYEQLLQKITSVQLENITDLHSDNHIQFEESFLQISETYYQKIAQILRETNKEV